MSWLIQIGTLPCQSCPSNACMLTTSPWPANSSRGGGELTTQAILGCYYCACRVTFSTRAAHESRFAEEKSPVRNDWVCLPDSPSSYVICVFFCGCTSKAGSSRGSATWGTSGDREEIRVPRRPGGGGTPPADSVEEGLRMLVRDPGPDIRKLSWAEAGALHTIMHLAVVPAGWTHDAKAAAV